jgi:hypothetical protein
MSTVVVPLIALAVLRVGDMSCDDRSLSAVAGRTSKSVSVKRSDSQFLTFCTYFGGPEYEEQKIKISWRLLSHIHRRLCTPAGYQTGYGQFFR